MTILDGVRLGSWEDLGTCRYLSPQGAAGGGGKGVMGGRGRMIFAVPRSNFPYL